MNQLIFLLIIFSHVTPVQAEDCVGWFIKAGLAPKTDECELKCTVTPVDMDTFSCTSRCANLCNQNLTEKILEYVPRLTEGDKVVIAKYPYEAYKVFLEKEKVDDLTTKIFKKPAKNDESDAFRHFVWSILLAKEIGLEKAKIFLNAHEEDSTQTQNEKEMDLANNQAGLNYFNKMNKENKKIDLKNIEKEALQRLRKKKLKVINPRFKEIPGGYYSK